MLNQNFFPGFEGTHGCSICKSVISTLLILVVNSQEKKKTCRDGDIQHIQQMRIAKEPLQWPSACELAQQSPHHPTAPSASFPGHVMPCGRIWYGGCTMGAPLHPCTGEHPAILPLLCHLCVVGKYRQAPDKHEGLQFIVVDILMNSAFHRNKWSKFGTCGCPLQIVFHVVDQHTSVFFISINFQSKISKERFAKKRSLRFKNDHIMIILMGFIGIYGIYGLHNVEQFLAK